MHYEASLLDSNMYEKAGHSAAHNSPLCGDYKELPWGEGCQARPTAYLWPGVSCDQTLQDQCVPLPNCVNTFTNVVFLHHARLPSMDDLGLSRSCREERRGKEGSGAAPLPPVPTVAAPAAGQKSHLLRHKRGRAKQCWV